MAGDAGLFQCSFTGDCFVWRGPAPFLLVAVPEMFAAELHYAARQASYGWGMIPVEAVIGGMPTITSLFPRNSGYLVPVKLAVQRAAAVGPGDSVTIKLTVRPR